MVQAPFMSAAATKCLMAIAIVMATSLTLLGSAVAIASSMQMMTAFVTTKTIALE